MSYSILRNQKHQRNNASKSYMHNERKNNNYSNEEIDKEKIYLNYHIKEPLGRYEKEFDRIMLEYNLKGQIKDTSVIVCELLMTSDKDFFDSIGEVETKRYFEECFNFVSTYKNLGEENIISAVIHMDESTPHMHLTFIPVVNSKDKNGNLIKKVCASDYFKGKNSYGKMQDAFNVYLNNKGFKLQRGKQNKRKHIPLEEYKKLTNFKNSKITLKEVYSDLPTIPSLNDIKKVSFNRDEKIQKEIIDPQNKIIKNLQRNNLRLINELNRQINLVDKAKNYQTENNFLFSESNKFKDEIFDLKQQFELFSLNFNKKYILIEKKNKGLETTIEDFSKIFDVFIIWLSKKFNLPITDTLMKTFEQETGLRLNFKYIQNQKNKLNEKEN